MTDTYKIIRFYFDKSISWPMVQEVINTGLTLEEAQKWCRDPETSSRTCKSPEGLERTAKHGNWFDGYDQE